jgi:hypothetical protein
MRRGAWLIVPVVLLGLLGVAVFAGRGPQATTAFTLAAGDCFDIPGDAQVGDIATLACDGPHDAEVFVAADMTASSPSGSAGGETAYPGDAAIAEWVGTNCGYAAEQAYLAGGAIPRVSLAVGYFFPPADAWTSGERQVTCYLHASDGSKLSAPLRSTGSSVAPS